MNYVLLVIKGILIGASILIPGLSGGTTALILNVYNRIMDSTVNFFKDIKNNSLFLFAIAAGGLIGFYISSVPIKYLLEYYNTEFTCCVLGIIIGSTPIFTTDFTKKPFRNIVLILSGVIFTIIIENIAELISINSLNLFSIIIVSVLMAIALILPGISITNILIGFGMYDIFVNAVRDLKLFFLGKVLFFLLISVLSLAKALDVYYKKYPVSFNMMILGMLLSSLKQLHTNAVANISLPIKTILTALGFVCSLSFSVIEKRANRI